MDLFLDCPVCKLSRLSIHEYKIREKTQEKWGIPLFLVYKTGAKLMLRQNSSTLVKYINYLIVISININENCRSKRKIVKKKTKEGKGVVNSYLRIILSACLTLK